MGKVHSQVLPPREGLHGGLVTWVRSTARSSLLERGSMSTLHIHSVIMLTHILYITIFKNHH